MGWDKDKKKSDDAKIADAQSAQEADRKDQSSSLEDRVSRLPELVQDAAAIKAAAGDSMGAEASTAAIRKLAELVESLSQRVSRYEEAPKGTWKETAVRCGVCQQFQTACKLQHAWLTVLPKQMDLIQYFQGVYINGARYFGRCQVPTNMVDAITAQVGRWEHNERRLLIPGGKVFGSVDIEHARGAFGYTIPV